MLLTLLALGVATNVSAETKDQKKSRLEAAKVVAAKEQEAKEQAAKEQEAKEQAAKEQAAKEQEAKDKVAPLAKSEDRVKPFSDKVKTDKKNLQKAKDDKKDEAALNPLKEALEKSEKELALANHSNAIFYQNEVDTYKASLDTKVAGFDQAGLDAKIADAKKAYEAAGFSEKAGFYQRKTWQRGTLVAGSFVTAVAALAAYHKFVNKSEDVLNDTKDTLLTPVTKIQEWATEGGAANIAKIAGTVTVIAVVTDLIAGYVVNGGYKGFVINKAYTAIRG